MKDIFLDANFPKTAQGRVYHLGIRSGEVANRIITVGSPSRAEAVARLLDVVFFKLSSERGFLTITGHYQGTPISVVSIGMGYPNMDFFVREVRECVQGDLVIVRIGSCGGLSSLPVASVVIPSASISIRRNYDFDFVHATFEGDEEAAYEISKPVSADPELHEALASTLRNSMTSGLPSVIETSKINASADGFYASQGRQTSFPDHNAQLIERLLRQEPKLATLEMETFHLLHLAAVWRPRSASGPSASEATPVPPSTTPVNPTVSVAPSMVSDMSMTDTSELGERKQGSQVAAQTCIRAAAVQMIFADRVNQDFIDPQKVEELEAWTGKAVLATLIMIHIPDEKLHKEVGCVWEEDRIRGK